MENDMYSKLDITKIIDKNPLVDKSEIDMIRKVVEESKRLGITPTNYRLATPMTPRHRPPIDHDNRVEKSRLR